MLAYRSILYDESFRETKREPPQEGGGDHICVVYVLMFVVRKSISVQTRATTHWRENLLAINCAISTELVLSSSVLI